MVNFFHEYAAEGVDSHTLARRVARGELVRLRRGAYADPSDDDSVEAAHRRLIRATWPALRPGAVVSHVSAGVLHALPALPTPGPVTIIRDGSGQGRIRSTVHLRRDDVGDDLVVVDGIAATSLARTASDLVRETTWVRSIMMLDHVLGRGVERAELEQMLARRPRRRGNGQLREAIAFADPGAQSPGESWSRVIFARAGAPAPVLQLPVHDAAGALIGIADMGWPELGVLGEFDGRIKYADPLLLAGRDAGEVVWAEKRREDRLRDAGWVVLRWVWDDLSHPQRLVSRFWSAVARAGRTPWAS